MDLELTGKVAIVTGGNRGIGASIAQELAREGADVFLVARDAALLDRMAEEISHRFGRRAGTYAADLRKPDAPPALVKAVLAEFGRIDILVNNAGSTKRGHFLSLTEEDWIDGYALKVHGYVRMARSAWPELQRSSGTIVNIVGAGSRVGTSEFMIGGSVNSALLNFTKSLADLGKIEGIRVNAINPGRTQTERLVRNLDRMAAEAQIGRQAAAVKLLAEAGIARFGRPEEIGWLTAFLASPRAAFINGSIIEIDGGETRAL